MQNAIIRRKITASPMWTAQGFCSSSVHTNQWFQICFALIRQSRERCSSLATLTCAILTSNEEEEDYYHKLKGVQNHYPKVGSESATKNGPDLQPCWNTATTFSKKIHTFSKKMLLIFKEVLTKKKRRVQ